jgi:hypothetical protein
MHAGVSSHIDLIEGHQDNQLGGEHADVVSEPYQARNLSTPAINT